MKLKLDKIQIGERQRLDLGDLTDLDSMADIEVGQIQPIVVHKTLTSYELVDGRRRLAKATQLGWSEVEVYEKDQMTESQKNKAELFADIGRKERTWQEVCLSVNKIHHIMKLEKAPQGVNWTQRATAIATGYSKGSVHYYLTVAEALETKPRDEEIWTADSYNDAFKILIQRQHDVVRAEQELRRSRENQQLNLQSIEKDSELGKLFIEDDEPHLFVDGEDKGLAQSSGKTPRPPLIVIQGTNIAFEDAVADEDFFAGMAYLVLVPPVQGEKLNEKFMKNVEAALRSNQFAVIWGSKPILTTLPRMGYFLIWNHVQVDQKSPWPYDNNKTIGHVLCKGEPAKTETVNGSIIACMPNDDGSFPTPVVDFSLHACPDNLAVLCPLDAPVVQVAECGRIPIWFEADKTKFDAKVAALKEYYERLIPDVTFKLRGED